MIAPIIPYGIHTLVDMPYGKADAMIAPHQKLRFFDLEGVLLHHRDHRVHREHEGG